MPDFYLSITTEQLPQSKPTSTTSTTEDDTNIFDPETDVDSLPFPAPLSRATFSDPSFSPTTFLSSLSNRHQSLSDLQLELQDLSRSLAAELLDLVNANYQSFLHLGTALTGGDEKCEEVRLRRVFWSKVSQ
ncbi:hypothetical protein KEM56_003373 [Ascosphaera pollenicola]|nr:hypothetical protein KEM56_003373 [Ascosphaera pollenicola]